MNNQFLNFRFLHLLETIFESINDQSYKKKCKLHFGTNFTVSRTILCHTDYCEMCKNRTLESFLLEKKKNIIISNCVFEYTGHENGFHPEDFEDWEYLLTRGNFFFLSEKCNHGE